RELLDGTIGPALFGRQIERDVVVSAKADEAHLPLMSRLPGIQFAAQEEDAFPKRSSGAGGASAFDLDHGRRELDDAGVEVDGAAGWKMVRAAGAMHERSAEDPTRRAEDVFGAHGNAVHDDDEFRLESDRRHRC